MPFTLVYYSLPSHVQYPVEFDTEEDMLDWEGMMRSLQLTSDISHAPNYIA